MVLNNIIAPNHPTYLNVNALAKLIFEIKDANERTIMKSFINDIKIKIMFQN